AGGGRGVEQVGADGDEPVEEVGVQRLEPGVVGVQDGGEPVLGDQEVHEEADPALQRGVRGGAFGEQGGAGLGAGLHLVPVDGDDEVRPRREVAVDGGGADAGFGRDVADGRVDA